MKLGFAIELIIVTAIGLTAARAYDGQHWVNMKTLFDVIAKGFLPGIVVAQAIFLLIEAIRRKSPVCWGIGRWTCGIMGFYLIILGLVLNLPQWLSAKYSNHDSSRWFFEYCLNRWQFSGTTDNLAWYILAFIATSRLAKLPRDPKPDSREWSCRVVALLIVLLWTSHSIHSAIECFRNPLTGSGGFRP